MFIITPIDKTKVKKAMPLILSIVSVVLNTAAITTAVKATVTATRKVDEMAKEGDVTPKDVMKAVGKDYILPATCFIAGQAATITSCVMSRDQTFVASAAIAGAYNKLNAYRQKNVELNGQEADDKVMIEIAKEGAPKYVNYDCYQDPDEYGVGVNDVNLYNAPDGNLLIFDEYRVGEIINGVPSDGYFVCSARQFALAREHLGRAYRYSDAVFLNLFYRLLGVEETPAGDDLCFSIDIQEVQELDIQLDKMDPILAANGEVIQPYMINYLWPPESYLDFRNAWNL